MADDDTLSAVFARQIVAGQQPKIEAAQKLLLACIALERAEHQRQDCEECEGEGEPEACGTCFPAFDDARVDRRIAIFTATGIGIDKLLEE